MKIMIIAAAYPRGGAEEESLAAALSAELEKQGHMADSFILPSGHPSAFGAIDASSADALITVGYPACMANHPNKAAYLFGSGKPVATGRLFCASEAAARELSAAHMPPPVLPPRRVFKGEIPFGRGGYFITEFSPKQLSAAEQLAREGFNICVFVPRGDIPAGLSAENEHMMICAGQPSDEAIMNARAYIHIPEDPLRAVNTVGRTVKLGGLIITVGEIPYSGYGNVIRADLADIPRAARECKRGAGISMPDFYTVSEFSDRLISSALPRSDIRLPRGGRGSL